MGFTSNPMEITIWGIVFILISRSKLVNFVILLERTFILT